MKTTSELIRDEMIENHIVRVYEDVEYDMSGCPSVVKNICIVIRPNGDGLIFNVSPYSHHDCIIEMVTVWIDCDCPENKDELGIPQKWDRDSLYRQVGS